MEKRNAQPASVAYGCSITRKKPGQTASPAWHHADVIEIAVVAHETKSLNRCIKSINKNRDEISMLIYFR